MLCQGQLAPSSTLSGRGTPVPQSGLEHPFIISHKKRPDSLPGSGPPREPRTQGPLLWSFPRLRAQVTRSR